MTPQAGQGTFQAIFIKFGPVIKRRWCLKLNADYGRHPITTDTRHQAIGIAKPEHCYNVRKKTMIVLWLT